MAISEKIDRRRSARAPLTLLSSTSRTPQWQHPMIEFEPRPEPLQQKALLYLTPSLFHEEFDRDDQPKPTSAGELPQISEWSFAFIVNLLEILSGHRQPAQVMARCHRVIYHQLLTKAGTDKVLGKLRSVHLQEPLDGLCEVSATIRYGDRLKALALRFEGVDGRWLCTVLEIL